ncbi:MAG TPA: type II toxin-antitoxin system VapC family toxin [Thermoanaerobaculia bacterium]|nr:type II toxin-antitoxin system VapC family toxin [Thermoanaerobaculia bacterium]
MLLFDVNVLIYAHRADAAEHSRYKAWLDAIVNSDAAYAVSDLVLSAFLRIVTNGRVFRRPSTLAEGLAFTAALRGQPNCVSVSPGQRHWGIFTRLCREAEVKGDLVPDAYYAALAIESGSEWVTTDRDYSRFPGLRWRHPLAAPG